MSIKDQILFNLNSEINFNILIIKVLLFNLNSETPKKMFQ
jgi:hypothetical protein